jgi:phosphoribosylglycinamide formyltransferase-1
MTLQPPNAVPLRVAVLGSTRGTAMQGILDAIAAHTLDEVKLVRVISDKVTAPILDRAAKYKIPTLFIDPKDKTREAFDDVVTAFLREDRVDLILMIGYMRIVSNAFVDTWRGRMLNIHPSLLPKHGGLMNRAVHEAVLNAKETETGCTIHQVTEEVDGGEIVLQKTCPVLPNDSADTLKDRVQSLEQQAFVEVLRNWRPKPTAQSPQPIGPK